MNFFYLAGFYIAIFIKCHGISLLLATLRIQKVVFAKSLIKY